MYQDGLTVLFSMGRPGGPTPPRGREVLRTRGRGTSRSGVARAQGRLAAAHGSSPAGGVDHASAFGVGVAAVDEIVSDATVRWARNLAAVVFAASPTRSATTGAALVRAASLALATCFCTGWLFHTLPETVLIWA